MFPYLFVSTMESLNCLIKKVREMGFIFGFKVGGRGSEGVEVIHLLFANDAMTFCEASQACRE